MTSSQNILHQIKIPLLNVNKKKSLKHKANDDDLDDISSKMAEQTTSARENKSIDKSTPETSYNVSVSSKYSPIANEEKMDQSIKPTATN